MATPEPTDWHHDVACRDADPELFFPLPSDVLAEDKAKAVCRFCPARRRCLDEAMANGLWEGIWGGLTPAERRSLHRSIHRAAARAAT